MVDCLNKLVSSQGSAPTELLKVFMYREVIENSSSDDIWEKEEMIYLASKTVIGANLEYILSKHSSLVKDKLINSSNFSAMIVSSLLTNPQDGKPDNYMVVLDVDESKIIHEMTIIGIDNDIAFADPIIKKTKFNPNEYFVNVRNVLYFFPQMDSKIDESFRRIFLSLTPELVIIEWLRYICKKSDEHEQLLKDKLFTECDFNELNLPIQFVPGTVRNISIRSKSGQSLPFSLIY